MNCSVNRLSKGQNPAEAMIVKTKAETMIVRAKKVMTQQMSMSSNVLGWVVTKL